jgi:alanyl-tRNA synthetase
LIIHTAKKLPQNIEQEFKAVVSESKRRLTAKNHTATHLLHKALRDILGNHVEQKGSLVNHDYLRFDFSHYQKIDDDVLIEIENHVNENIRKNITANVLDNIKMDDAKEMGAIALFGEVRVVKFDDSIELCGGTHVAATGEIGLFKIKHESSIAAGVRRIEAITAKKAEDFVNAKIQTLDEINNILKNQKDLVKAVQNLFNQNKELQKKIESQNKIIVEAEINKAISDAEAIKDFRLIRKQFDMDSDALKNLAFNITKNNNDIVAVLATKDGKKAILMVAVSQDLVDNQNINANELIKQLSKEIKGGGGGQAHFATAGGGNIDGIQNALDKVTDFI